jgi:sugar transferase (PEP-CTERM system associated)
MLRVFKQYYPVRNLFFIIGEGVFSYGCVLMASLIILGMNAFTSDPWLHIRILLITITCQLCLYYNDLYDFRFTRSFNELGIRLLQTIGIASLILTIVYLIFPICIINISVFFLGVSLVALLVIFWHFCYSHILNKGLFNQRIVLLGSGELAKNIKREISARKDCGYTVAVEIPEVIDDLDCSNEISAAWFCNKNFNILCELAQDLGIKKIVVGFKEKREQFPSKDLLKCRLEGIDVIEGNSFYELLTGKLIVNAINPSWFIFSDGFRKSTFRLLLKRVIDLLLSLIMMVLFSPLIAIVSVLIKVNSKGPVIYSQKRVGKKERIFRIHKFRSMVCDAEKTCGPIWAEREDERVTRVGRIIRKFHFDEIPQLWNVLKGEMSFVGPRPEREFFVEQLETIIPYYSERFTVKPGITGWAQVRYVYGASVEDAIEKLSFDLFYIKNMSILMDLMIVLRTIKIVLSNKGVR